MTHLIVEADGGSRGNPGVAGYGALVRDESGRVLRELAAPLGKASNNVAEYTGLIAGLRAVTDLIAAGESVERVDVLMDSKLVVEQMSGRWKIKHADMQRLAAQAREIAADISDAGASVTYRWIPRAENKSADALSNEGMDGHTVDRVPSGSAAGLDEPGEDDEELLSGVGRLTGALRGRSGDTDDVSREAATDADGVTAADEEELSGDEVAGEAREQQTPDLSPPVRLVLVRHGVTAYTQVGRLDGRGGADPELAPDGVAQAEAAARGVRYFLGDVTGTHVVTSSLRRARQTGEAIARALPHAVLTTEPDLDELCFGEWEGRTVADISAADAGALLRVRNEPDVPIPGGESYAQLGERVRPAVARLVERARAAGTDASTLVVVAHRGPIGVVLADVLGIDLAHVWRLAISPCSMTSIRLWRDGGVSVEFVNDTSHLR